MRSDSRRLALVLLAALSPNLIWILLDRTVWPWDQAWYAKSSVELFCTLLYDPAGWLPAMLSVLGRQAPGIAWAGQFFVPLGLLLGSIDVGLLLSIFTAQAAALFLTTAALRDLSNGRTWSVAAGGMAMVSAPLFIVLGHYFLVEMMQTMAVAWFVLIVARVRAWDRTQIIVHLGLATTMAMLAKASSPLYCVGPGLVALYYLARPGQPTASNSRWHLPIALGLALPLVLATVAWYYRNIRAVAAHIAMASSGWVAELYGRDEPFLPSLLSWLSSVQTNFFSIWTAVPVVLTMIAAVAFAVAKPRTRGSVSDTFTTAAVVSAVEILGTLFVFSLNSNREGRYLLPLVPYAAVIVGWSVDRLGRRAIAMALTALFAVQWAHVHGRTLGLMPMVGGAPPTWFGVQNGDTRNGALLDALVERTCTDRSSDLYRNVVGVQLLWLNPPALAYAATKRFAPHNTLRCDYEAVTYYEHDVDKIWESFLAQSFTYYIVLDPASYTVPEGASDKVANQWNEVVLRRVQGSGLFARQPGLDEHPGVMIYKRTRFNGIASGRSLSDRGLHDEAIAVLSKAVALEPRNVEALANLALALEGGGRMKEAVDAGERARALAPDHYWVNLGLARALFRLNRWKESEDRGRHAAAHAPGAQERAGALTIAGRSAFAAGNAAHGCKLLRHAAEIHTSREIQDEMAANRCGR